MLDSVRSHTEVQSMPSSRSQASDESCVICRCSSNVHATWRSCQHVRTSASVLIPWSRGSRVRKVCLTSLVCSSCHFPWKEAAAAADIKGGGPPPRSLAKTALWLGSQASSVQAVQRFIAAFVARDTRAGAIVRRQALTSLSSRMSRLLGERYCNTSPPTRIDPADVRPLPFVKQYLMANNNRQHN